VQIWIPCGIQELLFQPERRAPIFLGTFCSVATRSAAHTSVSRVSQLLRRARAASMSRWYSSILTANDMISSSISRYQATSLANPQSPVSATAPCKTWKSPPGPVSKCQNHAGSGSMGGLMLWSGAAYRLMVKGCWLGPWVVRYPDTVPSSLRRIHLAS
jgi:hypothetical protein